MQETKYLQIGEPIDGPWIKRIAELASDLKIHLAVGFAERRDQKMYNSVAVFSPVGELVLHDILKRRSPEFYREIIEHQPRAK